MFLLISKNGTNDNISGMTCDWDSINAVEQNRGGRSSGGSEETHDQELERDDPVRREAQLLPLFDRVTPRVTLGLEWEKEISAEAIVVWKASYNSLILGHNMWAVCHIGVMIYDDRITIVPQN